jgi:hypothetical protein
LNREACTLPQPWAFCRTHIRRIEFVEATAE